MIDERPQPAQNQDDLPISPDPRIVITSTGQTDFTVAYTYNSANRNPWTQSINGATATPYDKSRGTTLSGAQNVTVTATVVVPAGAANPFSYGNLIDQEQGAINDRRQRLANNTTTFPQYAATANNTRHIVLDNLTVSEGGSGSTWIHSTNNTRNTVTIPHNLGRLPNTCTVWFTNVVKGAPNTTWQAAVSWSWYKSNSGNPVSITATSTSVSLTITSGQVLHGWWNPSNRWTRVNEGYWRIVCT